MLRAFCAIVLVTTVIISATMSIAAEDWTFGLLPSNGVVTGDPDEAVGWGYTIRNLSANLWLLVYNVKTDTTLKDAVGSPDPFDYPALAPGAAVSVPYQAGNGLYTLTWDPYAPATASNNGKIIVSAYWYDGRPFDGGRFVSDAGTREAEYSATVKQVPEPCKITCPADIEVTTDAGKSTAIVVITPATTTGSCSTSGVTGTRSDGAALDTPYPVGTTTITWTATDTSNTAFQCTQSVTVSDKELPVITCQSDITKSSDSGKCSANVAVVSPTAKDNCSIQNIAGTRSDGSALNSPYPVGTTSITWMATDTNGNSAQCTQNVTINDEEPPVIPCVDITAHNDPGKCSVVLTIASPAATDNCGIQSLTSLRSDLKALTEAFPVGNTVITWTALDIHNNTTQRTQSIEVLDKEAPVISTLSAKPTILWPPNHKMIPVEIAATATDNCDPSPVFKIAKVESNEPLNGLGDGDTEPDWIITGNLSVELRSERAGTGKGRTYTIYVQCTDKYDNASTKTIIITAPITAK